MFFLAQSRTSARGWLMLGAIAGIVVVLGTGILIAHALEASLSVGHNSVTRKIVD
jgi:hypothetical protein